MCVKRGPPKILEGTEKGVPKEGHPKCACEKEVVPCILILYIEDGMRRFRTASYNKDPASGQKGAVRTLPSTAPHNMNPASIITPACFPLPGRVGPDGKFDVGQFFGSTHHLNPLHPAPGRLLPI